MYPNFKNQASNQTTAPHLGRIPVDAQAFLGRDGELRVDDEVHAASMGVTHLLKVQGRVTGRSMRVQARERALRKAADMGHILAEGECLILATPRGGKVAQFRHPPNGSRRAKEQRVSIHGHVYDLVQGGATYPAVLLDTPHGIRVMPDPNAGEVEDAAALLRRWGSNARRTADASGLSEAALDARLAELHAGTRLTIGA